MSRKPRRTGLLLVWAALAALIGAVIIFEISEPDTPNSAATQSDAPYFQFDEAELGGVQVVYQRRIATLMRTADGLWYQHDSSHSHGGVGAAPPSPDAGQEHKPDAARSAAIADTIARALGASANRVDDDATSATRTGLARSETMIAFYGRGPDGVDYGKPLDVLYLGDAKLGTGAVYAKLDGRSEIALLPEADIRALIDLVLAEPVPTAGSE